MTQIETPASIKLGVSNRILALRSFQRLLDQEKFDIAFNGCNDTEKLKLTAILRQLDKLALKVWINQNVRGRMNYMTYRALRDWAKDENIPYWSRMNREELIEALKKVHHATSVR